MTGTDGTTDTDDDFIALGLSAIRAIKKATQLLSRFYEHPDYVRGNPMDMDVDTMLHSFGLQTIKPPHDGGAA